MAVTATSEPAPAEASDKRVVGCFMSWARKDAGRPFAFGSARAALAKVTASKAGLAMAPVADALNAPSKLTEAAARPSEASEEGGRDKAGDLPSADAPPAAGPTQDKHAQEEKQLTLAPAVPAPAPPAPDPPATRLLRTLLGDAVPPEPPATATGHELAAWWKGVVQALDEHKRQPVFRSLDEVQRRALRSVSRKARAASAYAIPRLYDRFKDLGLSDDLRVALAWVLAAAPLIIHINLRQTLKHLLADTHYRNQFETRTSNGLLCQKTRKKWENAMFSCHYADAEPVQRVKYGVLNIANSDTGVESASHYGSSYLELKQDVRLRCTFGNGDSGDNKHCSDDLGVCEAYAEIMRRWSKAETEHVISIAHKAAERLQQQQGSSLSRIPNEEKEETASDSSKGERWIHKPADDPVAVAAALPVRDRHPRAGVMGKYQEMQVHGPVALGQDVARLVVSRAYEDDAEMVKQLQAFGEKFGVPVVWMDEDD